MIGSRGPATLRREIVVWYSVVLLVSLTFVTIVTFFLLQTLLERTSRETHAQAAEEMLRLGVPRAIPRLGTRQEIIPVPELDGEIIRRQTLLVTGQTMTANVFRSNQPDEQALRLFVLISALLIPLTAIGAAMGGRALLEMLLAPLGRLVAATREIGIGGLSRRVEEPEQPEELRELARAFNEMLTRLDRTVGTLTRFTADASHELRTPLTAIRGSIQVALARARTPDELEETLADVLEETEWMLHLVDGLLTLARGEEGGTPLQRAPVDLAALLADVCEVGEALAAGKQVEVRLDARAPLMVEGAAGPLRQVFLNLVSNGVKFTETGSVTITAQRAGGAGEGGWAEVRVRDTGVGIAPEEAPRVFDRFYRADAARERSGGTGLGLAIARLIVEQHGGRIDLWSEPGVGSEFRVLLPVRASLPALAVETEG